MKKLLIMVLLFTSMILADDLIRYVYAEPGINMRNSPSSSGTVLTTIPTNGRVKVLNYGVGSPFIVEGISGKWAKVSFEGKTGYIFNGFLVRVDRNTITSLEHYLAKTSHYRVTSPEVKRDDLMGSTTTSYRVFNVSLAELFLVARASGSLFFDDETLEKESLVIDDDYTKSRTVTRDSVTGEVIEYANSHHVIGFSIRKEGNDCIVSFFEGDE